MTQPKPTRQPNFFWQGTLILLPVLILAAVGISGLRQDRATIERETQQRAEEILQNLNMNFARQVHFEMESYGADLTMEVEQIQETAFAPVVTNKKRVKVLPQLSEGFKYWPDFNMDGSVRVPQRSNTIIGKFPVVVPPKPPEWRLGFTPEQLVAWERLVFVSGQSNSSNDMVRAYAEFIATHPAGEALENADFLRLQNEADHLPASNSVAVLMAPHPFSASLANASGIPVSSLLIAEILKRSHPSDDVRHVIPVLAHDVFSNPNFFTPALFDLAQPLMNTPQGIESLGAMKVHFAALQQMDAITETIQESGKLRDVTPTHPVYFWTNLEGNDCFCALMPRPDEWGIAGSTNLTNFTYIASELYPIAEIAREFSVAASSNNVPIPKYLAVTATLEGSIPFPLVNASYQDKQPYGPILARVAGTIPLSDARSITDKSSLSGLTGPRYTLQVHLKDSALMLASYRQRAQFVGKLILLAAVAACVGLIAAYRAFRRQLYLNEMKSNFVSSVSHELRAPIASVRLLAESLEMGKIQTPEKQHEYFSFIVQECRRLSSLIENVLDFSRIEQGRRQYEMESTDLAALTAQTVALMQTVAAEKQIHIVFQSPAASPPIEIDGKAIQQALVNLLDNAIKHSPNGSEIRVALAYQTDSTELSVEDHGEGIPAAEHARIFERFYRVGSELRRKTQGVGIGLSIVKHIVEAHGGRIRLRSAPGEGSCFTVVLPLGNQDELKQRR